MRGRFDFPGAIWTLVRTDFKVRYHGTVGGFLWALLKPLSMFAVLMAVFSFIFAGDPRYKLDLIVGLFLWDYFAESTKVGLLSLASRGYLLTKTRFPAWVLVVTSLSNPLITLTVFVTAMVLFVSLTHHAPTPGALLLFLLYLAQFVLITAGFALGTSALFLRYRDLNQVWEVVSQAGFFVAPVVYPLRILPERFHFYLYVWPPTPVIQFSRAVLVEGTIPSLRGHLMLAAVTALCLGSGILLFRRFAPTAAEHL